VLKGKTFTCSTISLFRSIGHKSERWPHSTLRRLHLFLTKKTSSYIRIRSHIIVYFCKAHMYIVLLNRRRTEKHTTPAAMSIGGETASSSQAANRSSSFEFLPETYATQATRGRTLVLASSEALLAAFIFFYHRDTAALIDWTLAQQAFNSCMIVLLDAIERRTVTVGAMKVKQAFVVFKDLYENNVHRLAGLAVGKISWGLQELRRTVTQPPGVLPQGQGGATMLGAGQNEAMRALCRTDTVMGHTEMSLLEDPGQQAVANEAFVPKAGDDSRTSTHPKEEQQGRSFFHMTDQTETAASKEHAETLRPADVIQGLRRSTTLRSAPTRYATRSEDYYMKPHGHTGPTSPTDFSMLHEHRLKAAIDHCGWQMFRDESTNPVHLHSQLQRVVALGEPENDMVWHHGWGLDESDGSQRQEIPPSAWSDLRVDLHGLHRHNSCPIIPPLNAQPPLLRPHYSMPSDNNRPMARPSRNTPLRTTSSEITPLSTRHDTPLTTRT
jgi:hypothetical protein